MKSGVMKKDVGLTDKTLSLHEGDRVNVREIFNTTPDLVSVSPVLGEWDKRGIVVLIDDIDIE